MHRQLILALILCSTSAWSQSKLPGPAAPGETSETDNQITSLQQKLKNAPTEYSGYDALGAAYLQKARETGDVDYFSLAEETLQMSVDMAPSDFRSADPLVHMALVCMGEHRFNDALNYAGQAVDVGSGNLAAFAVQGDA